MKFIFNFPEVEPEDNNITLIDRWYDRRTKMWVVQCKNQRGDQIGKAFYSDKKGSEIEYKRLKMEYGIE